jgi:hypothetical protein
MNGFTESSFFRWDSLLISLLGLIVSSFKGIQSLPDGLVAIGSAAVGALAGLLAPPPK